MTYETNEEWLCVVKIDDDGIRTSIPLDPSNRDYQEYLAQLENEGI